MSLHWKLVPVQSQEYEYGPLFLVLVLSVSRPVLKIELAPGLDFNHVTVDVNLPIKSY